MKTTLYLLIPLIAILTLAGCSSKPDKSEDRPLSPTQMKKVLTGTRLPQQFGFMIYQGKQGVTFAGQGRLHPNHTTSADMIEEGIPVVGMRGRAKRTRLNAMIDPGSPTSWMEFSTSSDLGAFFLGVNRQALPYYGDYNTGGVAAFAGVVTQLRIDNLFIENVPFYIRMSNGSLGPLARGVDDPPVDAILGYDNLSAFEYIQFDFRDNKINFSATTRYAPYTEETPGSALIKKVPGHGLAVEGMIDGQASVIVLDFAGDFSFARGDKQVSTTREVKVGDLVFETAPTILLPTKGGTPRIGRQLLKSYLVTICNREGTVYFEKLPPED